MNNNKLLYTFACVFLLSSSVVYGADKCTLISGEIQTKSINETTQLGIISIQREGNKRIETCGILGQITGLDDNYLPSTFMHQITCKGQSGVTTNDSVTEFIPQDFDNVSQTFCQAYVVEESDIIDGSGKYAGASGTMVSTGFINICTGENNLEYTGELCISEDQQ